MACGMIRRVAGIIVTVTHFLPPPYAASRRGQWKWALI
ncbi:hypothetical protein B4098_0440 [Heyndrickxia coagulans]|uniref:Uncharacterized protein n=1 Tax=Heyndrickxia coagulans TaxID=1398 RepID=A0A150K410_HEYCO|nr:hypothetical protein B4098_0440 [Heyndrickxia coagulans]KYC64323.1 hypothetical protein B4099_0515 [Heyndrickxia coagulans]